MRSFLRPLQPHRAGLPWTCFIGPPLALCLSGCSLLTLPFDDEEDEAASRRPAVLAPQTQPPQATPVTASPQAPAGGVATTSATPLAATSAAPAPAPTQTPATAAGMPAAVPSGGPPSSPRVGQQGAGQRLDPPRTVASPGGPGPALASVAAAQGQGGSYALQIGAFKTEAAAMAWRDEVAARLSGQSSLKFTPRESSIRVVERDGIFRVFVGELNSVAAARDLKSRIRGAVPDSFITRPD